MTNTICISTREGPPRIKVTIHSPENVLHQHIDERIEIKSETDWQAWVELIRRSLMALGYTNDRLVLGFYLDLINQLPAAHRKVLIQGIEEGRGLDITVEDDVVDIDLPVKYEPLEEEKESPLVVPSPGETDKILRGGRK